MIDLLRQISGERADRRVPHDALYSVERGSNRSDSAAQPTDGTGQSDVWPTQRIGSGLHALG
jgi:hypothetical protein